ALIPFDSAIVILADPNYIANTRRNSGRDVACEVLLALKPGANLLQRGGDEEFLRRRIVLDLQQVRLAAGLAVFDIVLPPPCGLINRGGIPFTATSTLKSRIH